MKTYYISWSSWFDSHPYDNEKMKSGLKGVVKNLKDVHLFGWSNQPKVVTFQCAAHKLDDVLRLVQEICKTQWIIINEKDW